VNYLELGRSHLRSARSCLHFQKLQIESRQNNLEFHRYILFKEPIDLLEFKQTPDVLSDAKLETLIEMAAESKVNIWHHWSRFTACMCKARVIAA